MPYLQQDDSPATRHALAGDRFTIGRDADNDIVLSGDMRASRRHAELQNRSGGWLLRDLHSRNGTFLNGERVSKGPLRGGDRIKVGDSTFSFVAEKDPRATIADTHSDNSETEPALSARENEVLTLLAQGLTDREIAEELVISLATVRSHLDRIRDKTGCRRRPDLTRLAIDLGLNP